MEVLGRDVWQARAEAHEARADPELAPVIARRTRGIKHPVEDFLFHYYNLRPRQLRLWTPGVGVMLEDAPEHADTAFHRAVGTGVEFDRDAFLAKRGATVREAGRLLAASAAATARFGCFGMHEWAMVYRLQPGETRHPYLTLRFPPDELARIVEEVGCRCSHFDAFRFFTPAARPLNLLAPTRERQADLDQPGCLHVNMDLYKWAGKLLPAVSSELLFDTFLLARDIREVDMAASAYDVRDWGLEPIRVEAPEGRAHYASVQRGFAERAVPLRAALLRVVEELLEPAGTKDPQANNHCVSLPGSGA